MEIIHTAYKIDPQAQMSNVVRISARVKDKFNLCLHTYESNDDALKVHIFFVRLSHFG